MDFLAFVLVILFAVFLFRKMFSAHSPGKRASSETAMPRKRRNYYEDEDDEDDWESGRGLLYWGVVRTFEELEEAVVIDVETTGLDPKRDRIIVLAMMKVDFSALGQSSKQKCEMFNARFNPGVPIPTRASEVHGIRDRDVADEPYLADHAQEIRDFIGDLPLVAHNASFDKAFLSEELKRAGVRPGQRKSYCTMRRFMGTEYQKGNMKGATLDNTAATLGLGRRSRRHHDAVEDVELTAQIAAFFAQVDRDNA